MLLAKFDSCLSKQTYLSHLLFAFTLGKYSYGLYYVVTICFFLFFFAVFLLKMSPIPHAYLCHCA